MLGFIISIHETAHFLAAKILKVKVKEFAIGFGPKILSKYIKETKYTLRLIPLGGFVNMLGEQEHSDVEGSFTKLSPLKRMIIVSSGGLVNIIFGLLVYFILMSAQGGYISQEVKEVENNYPASIVGIKKGDIILEVNNKKIRLKSDFDKMIAKSEGEKIKLTIKRDNKKIEKEIKPVLIKDSENKRYIIGVQFKISENNFKNNIYYGFWDTIDLTKDLAHGISLIFTGNINTKDLAGPVGISGVVVKTEGIFEYIYIISIISISIGITNLLPIPPLDGGKNVLLLIEEVTKKPIKQNIEIGLQLAGFVFLIVLIIIVTYNDILKII